jgi:RNase adaptor protein for sRNA GlmZ degradation
MALIVVGGKTPSQVETALREFEAAGFAVVRGGRVDPVGAGGDLAFGLEGSGAEALRDADGRGLRYVLVHHGPDDGEADGSYARAHHRVETAELPELARRLRGRARLELTCLSFGYKNGIPQGSSWVVDSRCLDNPYWVPELEPLDGRDARVREYVLRQPAAASLLEGLERVLVPLLPEYRSHGHAELTLAFGCTGGRHRSVALAEEMARRLSSLPEVDVRVRARELDG